MAPKGSLVVKALIDSGASLSIFRPEIANYLAIPIKTGESLYFYVYDRTGGTESGPGLKTFVCENVQSIENTDIRFEPQVPVELSKAGEIGEKTYFGSPFRKTRASYLSFRKRRATRTTRHKTGITYIIECTYCGKRFRRSTYNTKMNKHKDKYGNPCYGRVGFLVDQTFS